MSTVWFNCLGCFYAVAFLDLFALSFWVDILFEENFIDDFCRVSFEASS